MADYYGVIEAVQRALREDEETDDLNPRERLIVRAAATAAWESALEAIQKRQVGTVDEREWTGGYSAGLEAAADVLCGCIPEAVA